MFQVGRFDPREEDRKNDQSLLAKKTTDKKKKERTDASTSKKEKKQKRKSTESSGHGKKKHRESEQDDNTLKKDESHKISTLRVIAPETKGPSSSTKNLNTKLSEEAFDDLDITDDFIQEGETTDGPDDLMEVEGEPGTAVDLFSSFDPTDEIQRALHMARQPIQSAAKGWGLAPFLVANLERDGYENFFPIQALVIPDVIAAERHTHMQARDICVAAPTGSGKTLAFVLPLLNSLAGRQIRRLRALVVLPSRDLAKQVFDVFERYSEGSDLKIGLAVGQSDFLTEQKALTVDLVDQKSCVDTVDLAKLRYHFDPGNLNLALDAAFDDRDGHDADSAVHWNQAPSLPLGGISGVDVLVCTPGRLVDHLDNTPGFTLQHVRFLVIDEADRLLSQSYHNWIDRVVSSANSASVAAWHAMENQSETNGQDHPFTLRESHDGCSFVVDPITWRRGGGSGDNALSVASASRATTEVAFSSVVASVCRPVQLRKLLYSATLTKDPQKLAALRLVNPKHFDAHHLRPATKTSSRSASHLYSMPDTLEEYTVECTAEQKPIALLALVLEQMGIAQSIADESSTVMKRIIVVFTASLESTHRLARLLQLLWGSAGYGDPNLVSEFSSALNQKQRSNLMKRCNDPSDPVSVVVCSDGMSRGMDIEYVSAVINYDVPGFAKTYVHRCGRTARAGKSGTAISLLKGGQVGQFVKMRRLIDNPRRVQTMGVKKALVRDAVPVYRSCVASLRKVIEAEQDGDLGIIDIDGLSEWIVQPK